MDGMDFSFASTSSDIVDILWRLDTAKTLLRYIDAPDAINNPDGVVLCNGRNFPRFTEAFAIATEQGWRKRDHLCHMPAHQRRRLKLAMLEDTRTLVAIARREAIIEPKLFDGALLGVDPEECRRAAEDLIQADQQAINALSARVSMLKTAQRDMYTLEANLHAADDFERLWEDFEAMPPPTVDEQRRAKKLRRTVAPGPAAS